MATRKYRDDTLLGLLLSTGRITGGVGSVNTSTSIDITAGTGVIVDNYTDTSSPNIIELSWDAFTNVTIINVATQPRTFFGINSAGTLIQQAANFTQEQKREIIPLGVALHLNLTSITAVAQRYYIPSNPFLGINDLAVALGPLNVSGNVYSSNGANLNIDRTAGEVYDVAANTGNAKNPNFVTLSALTVASFQYQYRDGSGGITTETATTTINPANYDDGGGTLASVSSNRWSIQRIHQFSRTGNVRIEYGQATYNSLTSAEEALTTEPHVNDDTLLANAVFRAYLIVKGNASDLSDSTQAKFVEVVSLGSGSSSPVSVANQTNPELTVIKASAGTINAGQVVYATGFSNGFVTVELADSSSAASMPAMGIAQSSITDASTGLITLSGSFENVLDTSSFSVGDNLYVSETAGALTSTKPQGAALVQKFGSVLESSAITGKIFVSGANRSNDLPNLPQNNFWLGDVNGVPQETNFDTEVSANASVVANTAKISATTANVDAAGATMNTDSSLTGNSYFLDEDTLSSNDSTKVASQQSIKAYVDSASTSDRSRVNHTGTQLASTISNFASTVRSTVLTGLSTASATVITASDSVLGALGKIQAQISALTKTGVYRTIYIPASAMTARVTNGATIGTSETTTNDINVDYYAFATGTEQGVNFNISMPRAWNNGTIKAKFYWDSAASGSGTVTWGIRAGSYADSDVLDTVLGTEVTVADTVLTVGDVHISAATASITVAGSPLADELTFFQVVRKTGGSSVDAHLLGVKIQYLESTTQPTAW